MVQYTYKVFVVRSFGIFKLASASDADHAGQIYALIETLTKRPGGVRKLVPLLPQVSAS